MKQFKSILLGISLFLLHSCNLLDVDTVSSITGDGYWTEEMPLQQGWKVALLIYGRKTSHRKMVIAGRAITL